MTDKEIIRAEIFRRYAHHGTFVGVIAETREDECSSILDFIDSMQENPCDGCVNRKGCVTCENGELRETVQEEPASKVWHEANEVPKQDKDILMIRKEEEDSNYPPIAGHFHGTTLKIDNKIYWGYYNGFCYNEVEPPVKWAYISDLLNLTNSEVNKICDQEEPLEKEIEKYLEGFIETPTKSYFRDTIRYFYRLGKEQQSNF